MGERAARGREMIAREEREDFKEMELWEHLAELRTRLIRSICYLVLGLVVGWAIYPWVQDLLFAPLLPFIKKDPRFGLMYDSFTGPFMLRLQVAFFSGLGIAIPLLTLEAWGFIAPGLTRAERKACYLVFPMSLVFFFMGIVCGYVIMQPSLAWFMSFFEGDPMSGVLLQKPQLYLMFMVKMILAFGVCFQLPLVLMFLAYVGLVSSQALLAHWRMGVVACTVVAAVATPGGDPFSMFLMALPLAVLYLASIALCRMVENYKARREKNAETQIALESA
jgi:sec-independent protein translocase protein TatC